jgi:hypothetical protein
MILMAVCGLLLVTGLAGIVRWGGLAVERPWAQESSAEPPTPGDVARRYLWYVTVAVVAGLGAGLLVAGAGGRLAMRLLAATAGDAAQGRITEAEEVVGEITAGGTISFMVFTGLIFGAPTGVLYLLIRRWLPGGRLGGVAFGGLLLLVAASRIEPLRADNPDFDIVGPGWLAILVFGTLVVAHGMLVVALGGRYSRTLPLLSRRPRTLVRYAPLLLLTPVVGALLPVIVVGAATVVVTGLRPGLLRAGPAWYARAGPVALVAVALVALPGFVSAVADILGRGP